MKKVILSMAVIAAMVFTGCKTESKEENKEKDTASEVEVEKTEETAMNVASFGVRGNCTMCKSTIEKAAMSVEGVSKAEWHVDQKRIDVNYDDTKADIMDIHKAVAASGYDTDKIDGNEEAYKELPSCCQYDPEMKMSQSEEEMKKMKEGGEGHEGHDH